MGNAVEGHVREGGQVVVGWMLIVELKWSGLKLYPFLKVLGNGVCCEVKRKVDDPLRKAVAQRMASTRTANSTED